MKDVFDAKTDGFPSPTSKRYEIPVEQQGFVGRKTHRRGSCSLLECVRHVVLVLASSLSEEFSIRFPATRHKFRTPHSNVTRAAYSVYKPHQNTKSFSCSATAVC